MSRNAASGHTAAAKQCWQPACVAANHGRTPHQNGESPGRRTFWRAAHGCRQGLTRVQRYAFEAAGLLGLSALFLTWYGLYPSATSGFALATRWPP